MEGILSDEPLRRQLFPIVEKGIFFAHAGICPLPRPTCEAIEREAKNATVLHQDEDYLARIAGVRAKAASLFGIHADEIALLGPTSLGLSLVANGLDWKPGDEVIFNPDDYPANVYPWRALEQKGVKPVPLAPPFTGVISPELVEQSMTNKTRLVALASAHFLSGVPLDVSAIGKLARRRGVLFSLDAIQTLGAVRTPLELVDFASADSHKWMLGPLAAGLFIVKKEHQELLKPSLIGADNIRTRHFIAEEKLVPVDGAARYEPGSLNMLGIAGMSASIDLLSKIGLENIERQVFTLREKLRAALAGEGWIFPAPQEMDMAASGILSARPPRGNAKEIYAALEKEGVIVSCRWTRDGTAWLRFSPHFYNTEREVDAVLDKIMN